LLALLLLAGCPAKTKSTDTSTAVTPTTAAQPPAASSTQASSDVPTTPAGIPDAVRKQFPEVTALVEQQRDALDSNGEDAYKKTLAPDCPNKADLLRTFNEQAGQGFRFELSDFKPHKVIDGWVKGPAQMLATGGSAGQAPKQVRYTFDYTFKRGKDGKWGVYNMLTTGSEDLTKPAR